MSGALKQVSSPYSSGGGGGNFETEVQASFVALMLTGGYSPCLPCWPITKIKLQGRFKGYQTDDLIVFTERADGEGNAKLLGQIKHAPQITEGDSTFQQVIAGAWSDFNDRNLFTRNSDVLALITGPLTATDTNDVRMILEWARHSENSSEYFEMVSQTNFASDSKRSKLKAFRSNLRRANSDIDVSDEETYQFLQHFHLLGYDLDIKAGVLLSLLHTLIGQYSRSDVKGLWARVTREVRSFNQNAGTITIEKLPSDLSEVFKKPIVETIPALKLNIPQQPESPDAGRGQLQNDALAIAALLGGWDENSKADIAMIDGFLNGL